MLKVKVINIRIDDFSYIPKYKIVYKINQISTRWDIDIHSFYEQGF